MSSHFRRPMRYAHNDGHTDVCFSSDGQTIATCGSDGDVRLWLGLEDDDPTSQCVGEQALAVALNKNHLFVGTDNNNVQSFIFPGNPNLERDGIISRFTSPVTHIAVSEDGNIIASGSCDMEIQLKNIATSETIVFSGHKAPILGVSLDPQGKYMASSSCDGTIRVWTIATEHRTVKTWTCVPTCNSFFSAKCLGRVSWCPTTGRFLAIPDASSVIAYARDTWEKLFVLSDVRISNPFSIATLSPCGNYLAASTSSGDICVWNVKKGDLSSFTTHDKGTNISGLAWNPLGIGQIAFCDFTGQLGTVENCIPSSDPGQDLPLAVSKVNGSDDKPMVDDDGDDDDLFAREMKEDDNEGRNSKLSSKDPDDDLDSRDGPVSRPALASINLQAPFQPGSTPDHLQHRYLVWNSVGIIRSRNTETENSIDVEFNDTSVHHALHFNNYLKHTLGVLTEKAVLLACESQDDVPSKLVCMLVDAWDGQKEWTMSLPAGEEALSLAAGNGWVAVATNARNLRLMTLAGAQREVVSLPGPVVSMSGQGASLFIIYHAGIGTPGNQNLGYGVLRVVSGSIGLVVPWQALPLSPLASLQWLGFSDEASPTTLDSDGVLRMLTSQALWSPIADTRKHVKGKSDHYFVIGTSERYCNIRCVLCRGSHYPPTAPKPIITELEMQLPLCEEVTEKSRLEEKFWLHHLISPSLNEAFTVNPNYASEVLSNADVVKTTLLKMFALAAKSGLQQQALEMSGFMPPEMEPLVIKYASKLSKYILADKLRERSIDGTAMAMNIERSFGVVLSESVQDQVSPIPKAELRENIILASRQNNAVDVKTTIIQSGVIKNPFKKGLTMKPDSRSGLDRLSDIVVQQATKQLLTPKQIVKPSKSRQMKLASLVGTNAGEMTFVQWFESKKTGLAEEFPDLSGGQLTKQAMKLFKEEKESNSSEDVEKQETQLISTNPRIGVLEETVTDPDTKKRKIDNVGPIEHNGLKKSSKLMAFAFKKS